MKHLIVTTSLIALVVAVVIGIWIGVGFLPVHNRVPGFDFSHNGDFDLSVPGVFGDSFGWVNSLFTALAFAGVLVTPRSAVEEEDLHDAHCSRWGPMRSGSLDIEKSKKTFPAWT